MVVTTVGARLALENRAGFATEADAAIAKIDQITAAAGKMDAALAASMAKMKETAVAAKETAAASAPIVSNVGKSAVADQAALDAAAVAEAEKAKRAATDATVVQEEKAIAKRKSGIESLASNPAIKTLSTWGMGGLALGTYETVKSYAKFNALVTQSAIDAGAKAKDLPYISQQVLDISRQTGVAANDVANSFYRVQSALSGTHATLKEVVATTKDAAKLDVLFNIPKGIATEQTSRVMGAMMYSQLPGATNPKQIMALINSAVGRGDIRGQDMIAALGKLLPAAATYKLNAADTLGWVDTLTKSGMQGSQAGTLIAHSLQQLAVPSEQGNKAEQMLGINGGDLQRIMRTPGEGVPQAVAYLKQAMSKFNPTASFPVFAHNAQGYQSAMAQLQAWGVLNPGGNVDQTTLDTYKKLKITVPDALNQNTVEAFVNGNMTQDQKDQVQNALIAKTFGGAKGALPMLALMRDPNAYQTLVNSIKQGATPAALAESMRLAMNTPQRQMQIAQANVAATGIEVGKVLTPAATEFLRVLGQVASYLANHKDVLYGIMAGLTAVVGTAVGVEVYSRLMKIADGLKSIAGSASNVVAKLTGGRIGTLASASSSDTMMAAAETQMTAAETMQVAADTMLTASELGGAGKGLTAAEQIPGRLASSATTIVEGGAAGAAGAGAGGAEAAGGGFFAGLGGSMATAGAAIAPWAAALAVPLAAAAAGIGLGLFLQRDHSNAMVRASDGQMVSPSVGGGRGGGSSVFVYDYLHSPATVSPGGKRGHPHADSQINALLAQLGTGMHGHLGDNPFGNWQHHVEHHSSVPRWSWHPLHPYHPLNSKNGIHGAGGWHNASQAGFKWEAQQLNALRKIPNIDMTRGDSRSVQAAIKQTSAANKLEQVASQFGTAAQKHQVAGAIAERGAQLLKEASQKLHEAQAELLKAGNKHTEAANKLRDAAKGHADAAKQLSDSASKMEAAADKLGNTKIQAAIDVTALAAGLTANKASTLARG